MNCQRIFLTVAIVAILSTPLLAAEPLPRRLLDFLGLTAVPGQMRDETQRGNIWLANIEKDVLLCLTTENGYHSPIFSPEGNGVFALKNDTLYHLPIAGGLPILIQKVPNLVKLVGIDSLHPDEIIVLLKDSRSPLAMLSMKDGSLKLLPYDSDSKEDQRVISQILGQDRNYGTPRIFLKRNTKQTIARTIEWTDVFIQLGDSTPKNLSKCDGINCTQPTLSPDRSMVAFIKAVEQE